MMKFDVRIRGALRAAMGLALAGTLAACGGGGGGNAGTPVVGPSGPSGGASAVAADLSLTLSTSSIDNSGSKTVVATVTAVDSSRNTLANIPVQLSVADGSDVKSATVLVSAAQTDANGQVTGTVGIGQDHTNRTVTVTATSGSLTKTAAFSITGTRFNRATAVPSVVAAGAAGAVQYSLADVNGNSMAGVPIKVSGNGITSQSGTTDQNGGYVFNYTAPNAPGSSLLISATAGGAESAVTVAIPGGSTSVPVATAPDSSTLNLSANVVAVNSGSTNNQVTANAFFRTKDTNAPIANVRVLFGVAGDNGTGSIASGSNAVLSDATGTASTVYAPGAVSSPTNGVTIQACWKTSDFGAGETIDNCPAANRLTAALTIVANPVSITIGHDDKVGVGTSSQGLTYTQQFVVLVVDYAGNPKPDVQITPSVDLGGYFKGIYTPDGPTRQWSPTAVCPGEDLNRNGLVDIGEDVNNNGQLDPRKSDVSIQVMGSAKTDANGLAVVQLEYPKSFGSWVLFKITVTAAGVLSPPAYYPTGKPLGLPSLPLSALPTQADIQNYLYAYDVLSVSATDVKAENAPAFVISPYGTSTSCASSQ